MCVYVEDKMKTYISPDGEGKNKSSLIDTYSRKKFCCLLKYIL